MRIIDAVLAEMDQEAKTTRRFLEELPADKMAYRPHPKSMTTGQLAMHVATIPGMMSEWAVKDVAEMTAPPQTHEQQHTREEILAAFEKSREQARQLLGAIDDAKAMATWTFKVGGQTAMSMPRIAMIRGWLLNHQYHHRGQLGVYLRLMGAKVPSSYGPSGDENPMEELFKQGAAKH